MEEGKGGGADGWGGGGGGGCQVRAAEECDGEINGINKDKRSEKAAWGEGGAEGKKKPTEDEDVGFEGSVIQIRPFSVGVKGGRSDDTVVKM